VSADAFAAWDKAHVQELALPSFLISINEAVEAAQKHAQFAGPGGFNDADMLVVGLDGMYPYGIVQKCPPHVVGCKPGEYLSRERWGMVGGLSLTQQRTHFALYCMLASPLILGNDPRRMRREIVQILTAPDVIKIHQDPLGKQAVRVSDCPRGSLRCSCSCLALQ
jgi:alpha-galactosidase